MNEQQSAEKTRPLKKTVVLELAKKYIIITLGCIIYSLGISLFIDPADLSAGGMTGISIILEHFTPLDKGYWLIILNVPMLIAGLIFFGWRFLVSTGYATVGSSLMMRLWTYILDEKYHVLPIADQTLINAVVGGALFGIGMGLIFRMGASTAGTDVLVKLLRKRFRHIKTGVISLATDMTIVLCALTYLCSGDFSKYEVIEKLFFTALSVVVFTLMFDFVLYGGNSAKTVFIITEKTKCQTICDRILKEVDTGATVLDAKGAYTREDKALVMCVVKPFLYPRLRDVVKEEDKKAFMIVSSAKEIYGEGYQNQDAEEL